MKIDLKLTPDQIFVIADILETNFNTKPVNITQKVIYSILLLVAEKFITKNLQLQIKRTLFDTKKPHKISLKLHESFALHILIEENINQISDKYQQTITRKVLATLNKYLEK